jgi:hypothetical protein
MVSQVSGAIAVSDVSKVCTTAFYTPGNLARAMTDFRNSSFGARVNVFVKGVRIKTTHLGYKKTVKGVFNKTAKQHMFDCAEFGGRISVEAYFKKSAFPVAINSSYSFLSTEYSITLQYDIPLVDVGGTKVRHAPCAFSRMPLTRFCNQGQLSSSGTVRDSSQPAVPGQADGRAHREYDHRRCKAAQHQR